MTNNTVALASVMTLAGILPGLYACQPISLTPMSDRSGTHVASSAEFKADPKTVDEIVSTFKRAEEALRRQDVDGIIALYSGHYKHRGHTKDALQAIWRDLFQEYHDFSMTHILTRFVVEENRTPPTAQVTCSGSLWAISNQTGERVNIDSWFGEVHYMIYEDGAWRIRGQAWEPPLVEKESRFARPPHPFF